MNGKTFEEIANSFVEFAIKAFPEATSETSIRKLVQEMIELANAETTLAREAELADCIFCLLDAAHRMGINPLAVVNAMRVKLEILKERKWEKQSDGTYKHL